MSDWWIVNGKRNMKVQSYKELEVWKNGLEIADAIYHATEQFPRKEIFALGSQMERASVSISSNIAEGFMRQSTKEFIQFLYISLGSCGELETHLFIAHKRKYVSNLGFEDLAKKIDIEARMLRNLIKSLKMRL